MPTLLPQIIPSAFTSVGLLLWHILPPMAQHFYHLVLKTSSIPLLHFFLRNIYKLQSLLKQQKQNLNLAPLSNY